MQISRRGFIAVSAAAAALPALPAMAESREGRALQLARVFREDSPVVISEPWQPPPFWIGCYDGPPHVVVQVNRQCNFIAARGRVGTPDVMICGAEFDEVLRTNTLSGYGYFSSRVSIVVEDHFPSRKAVLFINRDDLSDDVLIRNMRRLSFVPNPENDWMRAKLT